MSWHYVAFRTRYIFSGVDEEVCDVREAYYDDKGKLSMISAVGSHPSGETVRGLREDIMRMLKDIQAHKTVTPADVPGYVYGESEVPLEG